MPDMLPFIFPVMADSSGQLGSWLSGLFALIYFPQSPSFVVRAISGMFTADCDNEHGRLDRPASALPP
ncbi:hypothetical protein CMQ_3521 [Grosmannia clavigera kw1407]|uniref:Uncharacterized protein n=1 Tax=Grosmannia clavigera (strain kw1407 / UAMH 11150) TaxID=655863 RepID=F0X9H7_GROCL|nr:uncharacterized protein CMQ_3521 [Grosmannia clavigera kw1407]EFX05452.1 hypothetical protein CMQ_3521 [Grosmannia clavigera kw1407]